MNHPSTDPSAARRAPTGETGPEAGGTDAAAGAGASAPPPRRGMRGSAKSMVISMIVVVAAVIGWMAMVPRVSSVSRPVADIDGIAREVGHAQHWDVAVADGLPKDWKPTNVRLLHPEHQPKTWQAGYTGPDDAYAAVRQTKGGATSWVRRQVGHGQKVGTTTIGGVTWTKYRRESNSQISLVRSKPLSGLTTMVTGKADWQQVEMLAGALVPYSTTGRSASAPATGR